MMSRKEIRRKNSFPPLVLFLKERDFKGKHNIKNIENVKANFLRRGN